MGIRNFGSLLIVFLLIMMIFGTHRLREIGNDLAHAVRNFRKGMQEEPQKEDSSEHKHQ